MAYRGLRFSHLHAFRDVGAAAVGYEPSDSGAEPDFPADNLIDDRNGTLFQLDTVNGQPGVWVDLGANFVTGIDRLIIPANHDWEKLTVIESDGQNLDPVTRFLVDIAGITVTAGTLIDIEFDLASTERYLLLTSVGGTAHICSQLIYTKIVTLSVDPKLAGATDEKHANFTQLDQSTGRSPRVQHGPDQRVFRFEWDTPIPSADVVKMEALIADVGMQHPFYIDPPSYSTPPETDEPVLCVKFVRMPRSLVSVAVPKSGTLQKTYSWDLIECID